MKRKDIYDLTDRVIVITGGLGQIGSQFTLELVDRGAKVAIFNHRIPDENVLKDRFPVDSGRLKFFQVDITKKDSVKAGLDALVAQWGVPHVLVNNAGIDTQPSAPPEVSGPFEDFPENIWREVLEVRNALSSSRYLRLQRRKNRQAFYQASRLLRIKIRAVQLHALSGDLLGPKRSSCKHPDPLGR